MASTGSITQARTALRALDVLDTHSPTAPLTTEERAALQAWPGWGPLAPAFDPEPVGGWAAISDELSDHLDADAYRDATECVDNSFFTPPAVIDAVWSVLTRAGFTGGRVLEPGCGSGRFMDRAPEGLDVDFMGVERDATSARIAARLHPEAEIVHERFEKAALPGRFDAVIGNVPFSSGHVHDPAFPGLNLHNYFIMRSLASLREGGYLAVITSRFSMDADFTLPQRVKPTADFVGAVRMPTGMFRSEGTEATTDLIVLRKNTTMPRTGWQLPAYSATGDRAHYCPLDIPYGTTRLMCSYWRDFPDHVAGEIIANGNYRDQLSVVTDDPQRAVQAAMGGLLAQVALTPMVDPIDPAAAAAASAVETTDALGRKEGSFHLEGDTLVVITGGKPAPVTKPSAELRALVTLKALALDLLGQESSTHTDQEQLRQTRAAARSAYEAYVTKWGPLNRGTLHEGKVDADTGMPALSWRRPRLGGFRTDPDYLAVMALEDYDQDTGEASPAPILLRRVNLPPTPITTADTPQAALTISLSETGAVTLPRIAQLLGLNSEDEAEEHLGDLVYRDPSTRGTVTPARTYLSGNVRRKLDQARAAATNNPTYGRNVTALEHTMPPELGPAEIRMYLGNPCIHENDIAAFLRDTADINPHVEHDPVTASWSVTGNMSSAAASTTWGTNRLDAADLTHYALNGKAPVVYDELPGGSKVRNPEETLAAQDKLTALQDRFATWVWEDPDRTQRVCAEYNERFNSFVARRSDGSHLRFSGLNKAITPHPWQRNIVDQISAAPATLCGHVVGAGKTLSMGLTAMTLRQFGLARKPMIVVPNHLLEQISRELQQAYPLGRFLIASKEDLAKERRRLFVARCATGDWDAVVITHQGFTTIPVAATTEQAWLEQQKDDYMQHLRVGDGGHLGSKQIARRLRSLETRMDSLRGFNDPDAVTFEQLGVDFLMVDEAHMFKRLPVASRSEGFSMGSSKRATDLLLKSQWIKERNEGRPHLALFTGTPWSNSLAETFVWQKFLQPEDLDTAGVADFDAWAAVFVRRETVVEVSPDGGGFRTTTRPTRMTNMVRLRTMFAQVSDVLSADDIHLERPDKVVESVSVDHSPQQGTYIAGLLARAEKLRSGGQSRTKDNMLSICGDGRRVALDPALVGVPGQSPKLLRAADEIAALYREHEHTTYGQSPTPGALQLVFCDQGTPNPQKGGQTYGRLRALLIDQGIPGERIRMIHEAKDDKARAALFAACRDGRVSVLIGSTEKMGTGTNIQTRLVAVHHLDAPWRPSDIDQREGRALRPGNLNDTIKITRYVTARTFDAFMWQTLERKAVGFVAMYDQESTVVEIDDIGDVAPSYTAMKALAAGTPLLMEQATLSATVARLRTLHAIDRQGLTAAKKRIRSLSSERAVSELIVKALCRYEELEHTDQSVQDLMAGAMRVVPATRRQAPAFRAQFSTSWRGLEVSAHRSMVEVRFRSVHVASLDVPVTKGRVQKAAQEIVKAVVEFQENIPGRREAAQRHLERVQAQIAEYEAVVDGYVFPRAAELAEAEAALAEVGRRIQAEADAAVLRERDTAAEGVEVAVSAV